MTRRLAFLAAVMLTFSACTSESNQSINGPSGVMHTLSGSVASMEQPSYPLITNARIEVADGADAGRFAESDAKGVFTMAGISTGRVSLTVTKSGFETWRQSLWIDTNMVIFPKLVPIK